MIFLFIIISLLAKNCKIFSSFLNPISITIQRDLNSNSKFCQKKKTSVSQVLTLDDGQDDKDSVFFISGNETPNADQHCLCTIKKLSRLASFIFKSFKMRIMVEMLRWRCFTCDVLSLINYSFLLYFPLTLDHIKHVKSIQSVKASYSHLSYSDKQAFRLKSLEKKRVVQLDLTTLWRLIYRLCNFNSSDFNSSSPNICNARGNRLKINTEQLPVIFVDAFTKRVVDFWDELSNPAVTAFKIKHFKDQLDREGVSITSDEVWGLIIRF